MQSLKRLSSVAMVLATVAMAQTVPATVSFNARLVDNGVPVQGTKTVLFKLYPTIMGGTEVWSESQMLTVTDGNLFAQLGASMPLDETHLTGTSWLEVTVDGTKLSPRMQLSSAPYAIRSKVAQSAQQVGALTEAQIQARVNATCGVGTAIRAINADGTVVCQSAAVAPSDGGVTAITSVNGGAGLMGGGSSGDITLGVVFGGQGGGSGTATSVARFDHTHSGYLPVGNVLTCGGTDKVSGINASGNVVCSPDAVGSVVANGGLSLSGTNQYALMSCASGNVLKSGGAGSWGCATESVTSVTGSGPLQASPSNGAVVVSLNGAVPLANGGTNATSAAGARTNLGAAASGANSDITSLSGLTTVLSTAQGGTGTGAPTATGQYLRNNGTNTGWSVLQSADLPSGSNNYIQNNASMTTPQSASLSINGSARIGGTVRMGTENGTTEVPRVDVGAGYTGMVVRRVNASTSISVVARTELLSFRRAGGNSTFEVVKELATANRGYVNCQGIDTAGAHKSRVLDFAAGAAANTTQTVFAETDNMVFFNCQFGTMDTAVNFFGHHTTLTLARTNSGSYWAGTLTSTFNQ